MSALPRVLGVGGCLLAVLCAAFVRAEDPDPGLPARIDKYIKQLGSDEFAEREAASKALEEIGLDAYEALLVAAEKDPDAEVRRRARALADGMAVRVREADAFVDKLLKVADLIHEHSAAEPEVNDLLVWAVEGLYQSQKREVPADLAARLAKARGLATDLDRKNLVRTAHLRLGRTSPLNVQQSLDIAVPAMLARSDPHGVWYDPATVHKDNTNRFGVGVRLETDPASKLARVVTPAFDGPAHKAGVRAGDLVVSVTLHTEAGGMALGTPLKVETDKTSPEQLAAQLEGAAGTKVTFTVRRLGEAKPLELEMQRGPVPNDTVQGVRRKEDGSWDYWLDPEKKIAYVRLEQFARDTARDAAAVLGKLEEEGVKALVLDLRFCSTGLISASIDVADLFLNDEVVLTVRTRSGNEAVYRAEKREGKLLKAPMVVLINGDSAGGAEVVAAALQDHKRAVVVGERSAGHGVALNAHTFEGRELKVTTSLFLRPSGKKLDRIRLAGHDADEWGVRPDEGLAVELPAEERDRLRAHLDRTGYITVRGQAPPGMAFKDRQLEAARARLEK